MDLYVYYRARRADALAIQAAVGILQERLRHQCGVRCGLKQRPRLMEPPEPSGERDDDTGRDTWMEIYLAVPAGFEDMLAAAVAASALRPLIGGDRHVEHFLDCLPCA